MVLLSAAKWSLLLRATGTMKSCLLVIDAQESFRHRPFFCEERFVTYLAAQNALIQGCSAAGIPVMRIFHQEGPESADNPFSAMSGYVRPIGGLVEFDASAEIVKSRHSALVGTTLSVWLVRNGIQRLIISGIRTEQCCETTTRNASDLGWEVDYVTAATLTFDMPTLSNGILRADDIIQRTETVLHGRFATICSVDEALSRAKAQS